VRAPGLDARQHIGHRKIHIVHAAKHRVVQAIQAHGDAVQARILQSARALRASSEPLVVRVRSGGRPSTVRNCRQLRHQHFQVLAQQRLAPGQPDLAHAMRQKLLGQPRDFLKAQQEVVRQVGVVLVEHFLGHAVVAAEVAAVGHADAQVAQRAAQLVAQQAIGYDGLRGYARHPRAHALVN
jgi:hypothetical protein